MNHLMNLQPEPFTAIQSGSKTIELRLYDEKRQRIRKGDIITFLNTGDAGSSLCVDVLALHRFDNFAQLYAALPLLQCGYTPETLASASPSDMEQYYSPEQQLQYGVIGIEIVRADASH